MLFPERRPFFVEGSGTFRFNMDCNDGNCTGLFYSRRIGRAPQGSVSIGAAEFTTQPEAATILGAAKLTGRVGQFSVGGLTAVTAAEHAQVAGFGGIDTRESLVEPLTAYNVARARREYANQSTLGFMVTSTVRRNNDEVSFLTDSERRGRFGGLRPRRHACFDLDARGFTAFAAVDRGVLILSGSYRRSA